MSLTAAELTAMRDVEDDHLPQVGTIFALGTVTDGLGGIKDQYIGQGTVAMRLSRQGYPEAAIVNGVEWRGDALWDLVMPYGTTLAESSLVASEGLWWAVESVGDMQSYLTALHAVVKPGRAPSTSFADDDAYQQSLVQAAVTNFWPLDEATGANKDDVLGSPAITLENYAGTPTLASDGTFDAYTDFDGTQLLQSVDTTPGLAVSTSQAFTWAIWAKKNIAALCSIFAVRTGSDSADRQFLALTYNQGGNAASWTPTIYQGVLGWGAAASPDPWSAIDGSQWVLVFALYDPTNNKIGAAYNDGDVVWANIGGAINTPDAALLLGATRNDLAQPWAGGMRHLIYCKGAMLTDAQRAWLYNSGAGREKAEITG